HLVGRDEVHDQHPNRTVTLRLKDEPAVDFHRRAQHDRQYDGLSEKFCHRLRIGMARENFVHRWPEPDHPAAQVELCNLEGHDGVISGDRRWRTGRDSDLRIGHSAIGHGPYVEFNGRKSSPILSFRVRSLTLAPRNDWACYASACKHQARRPFWACSRFSASSKTTDCGPSMTSSVTSSPRCAGRQCMNSASGLALAIRRPLTWWGLGRLGGGLPSRPPLATQGWVTTQRA